MVYVDFKYTFWGEYDRISLIENAIHLGFCFCWILP